MPYIGEGMASGDVDDPDVDDSADDDPVDDDSVNDGPVDDDPVDNESAIDHEDEPSFHVDESSYHGDEFPSHSDEPSSHTHNGTSSDEDDTSIIFPRPPPCPTKPRLSRSLIDLDSDNIIATPAFTVDSITKTRVRASSSNTNQTRYAIRSAGRQKKKLNYDMKFHPMDSVMRPNAKRTRLDQEASASESNEETKTGPRTRSKRVFKRSTSASSSATASTIPMKSEDVDTSWENLFARPIEEDWHDMNRYDRFLFRLQGGAPVRGTALQMSWQRTIQVLIKEKYFTRQQFNAWGGEKNLKIRYELVRLAMRRLFGATKEEPSDRKDRTIYLMEGWEVFDLPTTAPIEVADQISTDDFLDDEGRDYVPVEDAEEGLAADNSNSVSIENPMSTSEEEDEVEYGEDAT